MDTSKIIGGLITSILLNVIVLPLLLIWSINTLLGMHIEFSAWNWLASWVLISCFRGAKIDVNK